MDHHICSLLNLRKIMYIDFKGVTALDRIVKVYFEFVSYDESLNYFKKNHFV